MNKRSQIRVLVFSLPLLLGACGSLSPPVERPSHYSQEELLQGSRFGFEPIPTPNVDILAVNDDMRAFLRHNVPDGVGKKRKVELILGAMLDQGLELHYNNFKTYTAEEAFYSQEGNCLSFTNLFVALAREAGVNARFQEVEIPPVWVARGETWMLNLHVNALVNLPGHEQVVDFNLRDYNRELHRRVLSDRDAKARYHNNMGVHWMNEGDSARAFANLKKAIALRPSTGYFWTNLGTLYRRENHLDAAESAYLVAVEIDDEPVANSNLARLYEGLGEPQLATWYRHRVDLFRAKNPYYLFHLAEQAYANKDYDEARGLLLKALHSDTKDHRIYRLLGLTHLQQGDRWLAKKRFRQAAALAEGEARERYNHKLELLAGA